jgi:hypothetical protein
MFWNKYFLPSFLLLTVVAILHWIASGEGYYWTVEWYDFMMHFLGGVWVALFGLWVSHTTYGAKLRPFASARNLILFTLFVGVAWELFEIFAGFSNTAIAGYRADTIYDLIMDTAGVTFVVLLYRPKKS